MGILSDRQIRQEIKITPMAENEPRPGMISYGLSSFGYDCRCGRNYKVFTNIHSTILDPLAFDPKVFVEFNDVDSIIIPGNSFVLAETLETFEIPRDILAVCLGKSTLARLGIIVTVTPLEPTWKGKITVEISNTSPVPCKIYSGHGIMQCLFLRSDDPLGCEISYEDKRGIYQGQTGLTLPRIRE